MPFELLVALRFLREGRMQTLLIVAGVTAGVAVVVFITALITGLQANLVQRTLGSQAHIVIRPPEEFAQPALDRTNADIAARIESRAQRLRSIDQWEAVFARLAAAPGIVAASPMVSGPAFASRGNASKSVAILGVDPDLYRKVVTIEEDMVAGKFRPSGTDAVIGVELARDLGVAIGDKIRLATAGNREDLVTVVGMFDVGTKDLNRRWVFTSMKLAQNLLDLPGGVTNIDLTVVELFGAEATARTIAGQTGLLAESWMQTNAQLLSALRAQTASTLTIRTFVTLIVALGIASVLVVSVVQKQKEIGILRAMGASEGRILRVFLIQGGLVAFAGSLLGSGIAAALVTAFARFARNADGSALFTPLLEPALFVTTWLVALATGVLAAALPARRAAKLDPAQAIRST
ncbi:MAG: ABC transporter permease [Burkholderiales bacterium]|nr:ABC transporter permease [Burkholderiales bacterium]